MQKTTIPQDDLLDVIEMTQKLESYISKMLKKNELTLGISALMSASVNSILSRCNTLDDIIFYRGMLNKIFDISIKCVKIKKK